MVSPDLPVVILENKSEFHLLSQTRAWRGKVRHKFPAG
jgi:hypothetical protein